MRKFFTIILLLCLSLFIQAEILDKIVAKVGRDIILESDLKQQINQLKAAGVISGSNIDKQEILNDMINSKLIIMEAEAKEYEIDNSRVKTIAESELQRIIKEFPSEEQFKKELKKQGLTTLELKEYYSTLIREQMIKDKIIQNEIKRKITLTEAELKDYYQENLEEIPQRPAKDKIGMIMVKVEVSPETDKKALLEINKIRDQILSGESFDELAKTKSDCPSANNGGDLGYFGKGSMVKPFEKVAFELKEGEISDVVKTNLGYHIIKLEDRKGDEIRARHILKMVQPDQEDIERTRKLMQDIKKRLEEGEDFSVLAKEYSMDESSAANNGILGEFTSSEYPEMFAEHLKKLDYGKYSDVIKEGDNFYIFAKLEKIPARKYKYDEIKNDLKEFVRNQKQMELYREWTDKLRQKYYVEILLDEK